MNNGKSNNKRPKHGPDAIPEKPKDLKVATSKLLKYLHNFMPFIIVALVLSCLSSVFSIVGPNKLSDLTDYISKGLIVNTDNITKISKSITDDLTEENIGKVSMEVLTIKEE